MDGRVSNGAPSSDSCACARATRSVVLERADGELPGAPATHTIIGNADKTARPGVQSTATFGRSPPLTDLDIYV